MTTGHPTNSARRTILIQGLAAALFGAFIGGLRVAVASEAGDGGAVSIELFAPSGKSGGVVSVARLVKSDADWRHQLSAEAYPVARHAGTEADRKSTRL